MLEIIENDWSLKRIPWSNEYGHVTNVYNSKIEMRIHLLFRVVHLLLVFFVRFCFYLINCCRFTPTIFFIILFVILRVNNDRYLLYFSSDFCVIIKLFLVFFFIRNRNDAALLLREGLFCFLITRVNWRILVVFFFREVWTRFFYFFLVYSGLF